MVMSRISGFEMDRRDVEVWDEGVTLILVNACILFGTSWTAAEPRRPACPPLLPPPRPRPPCSISRPPPCCTSPRRSRSRRNRRRRPGPSGRGRPVAGRTVAACRDTRRRRRRRTKRRRTTSPPCSPSPRPLLLPSRSRPTACSAGRRRGRGRTWAGRRRGRRWK